MDYRLNSPVTPARSGFSDKARKIGEDAEGRDIAGVFALPSDAYEELRKSDPQAANRYWGNIQNRRFKRAENNLRQSSSGWNDVAVGRLDPNLHQWGQLGGEKPKQVVTSPKSRETYIAKIQKRVGLAKGSWLLGVCLLREPPERANACIGEQGNEDWEFHGDFLPS